MRLTPNEIDNVLLLAKRREPTCDQFTLDTVEVVLLERARDELAQIHESNARRLMECDKRLEKIGGRDE